jgi:SEC-C motif-containing protein
MMTDERCPCQSGDTFGACCARFLNAPGTAFPPTAEALMRSRFTAFATGNTDYLLRTWHPGNRPAELELDPDQHWYRLDILETLQGGPLEATGVVRFRAHYRHQGVKESFAETSSFVRVGKQWLYVDALDIS